MRTVLAAGLLALCTFAASCSNDTTSPSTNATYTIFFGTPTAGLDVSACNVTVNGGVCSQQINVKADGSFHELWTLNTSSGQVQVDGTMGSSSVTAVFKCIATTASGSMNATTSGSDYAGTALLSGKTVAVRVSKGATTSCS